jgi:hemin uptake protein HemP
MNRGITSQPIDWTIDYSKNRVGDIYGNAAANIGGMVGQSILQFAKDSREKEEKKRKEESATQFLMKSGSMGEKEAQDVVKGVGIDNWLRFQQVDNDKKQVEAQAEANAMRAQAATMKAQDAERKAQVLQSALQQTLQGGPQAVAPNQFLQLSSQGGATGTREQERIYNMMLASNKAAKEKDPFTPSSGTYQDGTPYYTTSPNSVQVGGKSAGPTLKTGDTEEYTLPNGQVRKQVYQGGKWVDSVLKEPVYLTETDMSGTKSVKVNPLLMPESKAPAAPAVPEPIKRVSSQKEFDELPAGTIFLDHEGKRRRK